MYSKICVFMYIHTHYIPMHVYVHVYIKTCVHAYIYVIYVCIYILYITFIA